MKRLISLALAVVLTVVCGIGVVSAAPGNIDSPNASPTITSRIAYAYTGDNTGEVSIDFEVTATNSATSLGVSSIVIHKPDGSTYTVLGSVGNGFIGSGLVHAGTYTYHGVSGEYYYADVNFFSTIGSVTDRKTSTTRSAVAK